MKKIRTLTMVFTFWILVILMSVSWLFFLLVNNIHLIFEQAIFLFVLVIAFVGFSLSMFFVFQIVSDLRVEIRKEKERLKNIRDVYQYDQLLDPPSMYT